MAEITRAVQSDDDWASTPAPEARDTSDPERGLACWGDSVQAVAETLVAANLLARVIPDGARSQIEGGMAHNAVALVALLQDIRRSLAETEAYLAREIGRDEMAPRTGVLPDGRQFKVQRGADRKAWSHDDWKRDVREKVAERHEVKSWILADPETGESVNLAGMLEDVQGVFSSAAPKVTALKRLGLDPGDYCETYPGPFSVQVSAPGSDDA